MNKKAQVTIEFTFTMIVVMLMAFAVMRIMRWAGYELVSHRQNHESVLTSQAGDRSYSSENNSQQIMQISLIFHSGTPMDAIWDGK